MSLNYNVTILQPSNLDVAKICIWKELGDDKINVFVPVVDGGKVRWTWKENSFKSVPPATFEIPATFGRQEVMKKLSNELFKEFGIKPDMLEDEGVIDSMRDHLEDLRTLIFKFDFTRLEKGAPLIEEKE